MKYFIIAFLIILFVIFYVWQNIEVMKLKIEFRGALMKEQQLVTDMDRLWYEIERYKTMEVVEAYAKRIGMRSVTPNDFVVIRGKK